MFNVTNENIHVLQKHFWLDHLELYASFYDESLFDWLDFENSNYFSLWEFVWVKNEIPNYQYKITFSKGNYPYFAFYKWKKVGNVFMSDYVCCYSTAFRIEGDEYVRMLIDKYFSILTKPIKRVDLCLDIILDINELREYIWVLTCKHSEWKWKSGKLETLYIWDKSSANKRYVLRMYDKLLDINKKRKNKLYQNYLIHENITRIEIEIRREYAKNMTYEELWKYDTLLSIYKNFVIKYFPFLEYLSPSKISLYNRKKDIDQDILMSITQKDMRVKTFSWHARSLLEMWICPLYILIKENIADSRTLQTLNASCDLRILKERIKMANYWRDEIFPLLP